MEEPISEKLMTETRQTHKSMSQLCLVTGIVIIPIGLLLNIDAVITLFASSLMFVFWSFYYTLYVERKYEDVMKEHVKQLNAFADELSKISFYQEKFRNEFDEFIEGYSKTMNGGEDSIQYRLGELNQALENHIGEN